MTKNTVVANPLARPPRPDIRKLMAPPQAAPQRDPSTITLALPEFDHIPDGVYQLTDTPDSLEQARSYERVLKSEITDLLQLLSYKFEQNGHWFNGDRQVWEKWRYAMKQKHRIKNQQLFLIKSWIDQYLEQTPLGPSKPGNIEALRNRIKTAETMAGFTTRDFSKLRREVVFIRRSIGEIADLVLAALEEQPVDIATLQKIADQLTFRDREIKTIENRLDRFK